MIIQFWQKIHRKLPSICVDLSRTKFVMNFSKAIYLVEYHKTIKLYRSDIICNCDWGGSRGWFVRFELCLMHTPENWNQSVNWLDTKTINQMLSRNTIFYNKIQMHSSTTATTTKARIKEKKWTGNMQEINSPMRRWNLSYHRNRKYTSKKNRERRA